MNYELHIQEVQITPVRPKNGLLSFASVVINKQIRVANLALYTAPFASLKYRLVYPDKRLGNGASIPCLYPISREVDLAITLAVVNEYEKLMGL